MAGWALYIIRSEIIVRPLNILTLLLVIVGGINWGLVGLLQVDLVAEIFGGQNALAARLVYILVGLSAVWQLVPFVRSIGSGEVVAERGHR